MASPAKAPIVTTPPPRPAEPLDWKSAYPAEAWKQIRGEGIYLGALVLLMVLVAFLIFEVNGETHPVLKDLLCCGLGGIAGSWIYAIRWYVKSVIGKLWAHDFIVWRLTAPWMGIFLAVSTYLVLKAGMLGVTIDPKLTGGNIEKNIYAYTIGFLAGLFSDEVMKKLAGVANTVFGKAETEKNPPETGQSQAEGPAGGGGTESSGAVIPFEVKKPAEAANPLSGRGETEKEPDKKPEKKPAEAANPLSGRGETEKEPDKKPEKKPAETGESQTGGQQPGVSAAAASTGLGTRSGDGV